MTKKKDPASRTPSAADKRRLILMVGQTAFARLIDRQGIQKAVQKHAEDLFTARFKTVAERDAIDFLMKAGSVPAQTACKADGLVSGYVTTIKIGNDRYSYAPGSLAVYEFIELICRVARVKCDDFFMGLPSDIRGLPGKVSFSIRPIPSFLAERSYRYESTQTDINTRLEAALEKLFKPFVEATEALGQVSAAIMQARSYTEITQNFPHLTSIVEQMIKDQEKAEVKGSSNLPVVFDAQRVKVFFDIIKPVGETKAKPTDKVVQMNGAAIVNAVGGQQ